MSSRSAKSRSKSSPSRRTKKNNFNNVPIPALRKKFYDALEDDVHRDYILILFKLTLLLEKKITGAKFTYGRYKFSILSEESGHCMEFFGGALFYLLYLEAEKMGLFKEEDYKVIRNFIDFKTIDIDTSVNFKISPNIESFKESTKTKILDNFAKQYHGLVVESFNEIVETNEDISSFLSFLATEKNFKGFDFIKGENIIPHLGPGGICSISLQINSESLQLRPQINTCVKSENNCDHIIEIISVHENQMSNVQLFNLSLVDEFMGRNIILLCLQNIDRFYRDIKDNGINSLDKGELMVGVKNLLNKEPTFKTKYMQGFYRVELIFIIITRLLERKSSKFNNLKSLLLPTAPIIRQIHNVITHNNFILGVMSVKKRIALEKEFRKIRFTQDDVNTLETSHYILNTLIEFWVTIHEEILKNFRKQPHELIKYSLPPAYSSSNNDNNRLYSRVESEMNINFESPGWESKISDSEILQLMKTLKIKTIPITKFTRKVIIKNIKKKLNLT